MTKTLNSSDTIKRSTPPIRVAHAVKIIFSKSLTVLLFYPITAKNGII